MEEKKNEILENAFLLVTENSGDDLVRWKIVGKIDTYEASKTDTLYEFKTSLDGWLAEFNIKVLSCGLVLVSPDCIDDYVEENKELIEALQKYYNEENPSISKLTSDWQKLMENFPQDGNGIYQPGTITTTTNPNTWTTKWYYDNSSSITSCSPDVATWTSSVSTCSAGDTTSATATVDTSALSSAYAQAATCAISDLSKAYINVADSVCSA